MAAEPTLWPVLEVSCSSYYSSGAAEIWRSGRAAKITTKGPTKVWRRAPVRARPSKGPHLRAMTRLA